MAVRIESQAEPIPGYRLIERIGCGGFGEVWRAEAPGGLHKAIKFVYGDLKGAGESGQRAEQELKALSRVKTVRHPYILSLERYDIIDGQLIIVMELAERSLGDRQRECKDQGLVGIPRDELLCYMEETAEALDLMNNTYQLQHLDIKPQNLFLMFNHIKVADFGLVKDLEGAQASVTGGVTPVYAAPETFDGIVTRFSDQYSLAIVYQELLTGKRPFNGSTIRQLIVQHLQAQPNLTSLSAADQPIIARALAKSPDARFPTCAEMVRLLRRSTLSGAESVAAPAPPIFPRPDGPRRYENDETPSALLETGLIRSSQWQQPKSDPAATTPAAPTAEAAALRPAEPQTVTEITDDGILFPALVIGLGHVGMTVLQALRGKLHNRFGSLRHIPSLRLLLLDTDPEVIRAATRGRAGAALTGNEVQLTGLNRVSHYLKPRDGRPAIEKWLHRRMLYRIPRSLVTTGIRALGRLAFSENYRPIVRRVQTELKACSDISALRSAGRETGLGFRTNRPRVYVVANLAGGTGGGMFIDVAYTVRAQLKKLGYDQAEIIGVFLLPKVDRNRNRTLTLGNTYAALKELEHFAKPGVTFTGLYHELEPPIEDATPPFHHCIFLPLPDETDDAATSEVTDLASHFLFRDLCSPLGRTVDPLRRAACKTARGEVCQTYQTFGMYQLVWPRRALLRQASRRICHNLVQRWLTKDSKPIQGAVNVWVEERWHQQGMGADQFITRLRLAAEQVLQMPIENACEAAVKPLAERCKPSASGRQKAPEVTPEDIRQVLDDLVRFAGKPTDDSTLDQPAEVVKVLRDAADQLALEWEQKLAEIPASLIEEPAYRLAGAEEAIRQITTTIEQVLQHHEPLARELNARAAEAYSRLEALAAPKPGVRRVGAPMTEVLELLRAYPKWRFQSVVLQMLNGAFLLFRGHLSDDLRDVNFCRIRLTDLALMFATPPDAGRAAGNTNFLISGRTDANQEIGVPGGRALFPSGCATFREALDQFLACLSSEDLLEVDMRIEEGIKEKFTAVVNICLTPTNILGKVETAMLQTAEAFAEERLAEVHVADLYLSQFAHDALIADDLAGCFEEAKPLFTAKEKLENEIIVLASPLGPAADQLRDYAVAAMPGAKVHAAPSDDDLILYREWPQLSLTDLEQFGPVAQDAYRQMASAENFTPHTRIDVQFD